MSACPYNTYQASMVTPSTNHFSGTCNSQVNQFTVGMPNGPPLLSVGDGGARVPPPQLLGTPSVILNPLNQLVNLQTFSSPAYQMLQNPLQAFVPCPGVSLNLVGNPGFNSNLQTPIKGQQSIQFGCYSLESNQTRESKEYGTGNPVEHSFNDLSTTFPTFEAALLKKPDDISNIRKLKQGNRKAENSTSHICPNFDEIIWLENVDNDFSSLSSESERKLELEAHALHNLILHRMNLKAVKRAADESKDIKAESGEIQSLKLEAKRLVQNRLAARRSRNRKRMYIEELENRIQELIKAILHTKKGVKRRRL